MKGREYLSEPEAALYLGLSLSTMRRYRKMNRGPRYVRISDRILRYSKEDLDEYVQSRTIG